MKKIFKIVLLVLLTLSLFNYAYAWIDWLENMDWASSIENASSNINTAWVSISDNVNTIWLSILRTIKYIFSWVMLIFIVYAWAQMILSMWTNEEQLASAKRTIRYSMIWLVFINIPWTLLEAFTHTNNNVWGWISWIWENNWTNNLFIDVDNVADTLNNWIIAFIEIVLVWVWILVIIIAWLRMIMSRWEDETISNSKKKIQWVIIWLVFVWFIEAWQSFVYSWEIDDWKNIFESLSNLLLFISWPIAIFFLTLAWYYFITSGWDEEKIKKGKNIIINIVLWTVLIMCSYAFLLDLSTLLN